MNLPAFLPARSFWLLTLCLTCVPAVCHAQRAGLWETRISVAGAPAAEPIRSCAAHDAPLRLLNEWPANCDADEVRKTATGFAASARCQTGQPGMVLIIRRELSGDLDRHYRTLMQTRLQQSGAQIQPTQRSEATNRYLGPCDPIARTATSDPDPGPDTVWAVVGAAMIFIVQLLAFAATMYAVFRGMAWLSLRLGRRAYERAIVANITVDQAGAATIPVLATFTGVRGFPWWYAIAANNAKPLLVIGPDGIRFRVIRQHERRYVDIECVDVRQARGTVNLDFTFRGSLLTFAANLGAVPLTAHVLSLLPASVPLSPRAIELKAMVS
ncbi:DUF3617 domain-containing protein [Croceibacterium mercuriale]|uniref:DUF3617 domain-containing protein n=1 Tax=Croceibacterium mercuriale TaxID=1572751 RepID=UPI00126A735F|nr:hypothetical protein [Croceibacterium mercuriale]